MMPALDVSSAPCARPSQPNRKRQTTMKQAIQLLVGLIIGAVLVWFLVRDMDWAAVGDHITQVSIPWLIVAQIFICASFPIRVQRWTYIVRAAEPDVSFRAMFSATQIAYFASFTILGRVGEILRPIVLNRLSRVSFSKGVALVGLDRLTDLFGLICIMSIALFAYQPTDDVIISEEVFGTANPIVFSASQYQNGARGVLAAMGVVVAGYLALFFKPQLVLRIADACIGVVSKKLAELAHGMIENFTEGLHIFRSPGQIVKSLAFSLATWGVGVVSIYAMLQAFHFECPWYTPFVMQALLAIFIGVPGAPGFVGQFHAPLVITLAMILPPALYNDPEAKAFAIVMHLSTLPAIIVTGIVCLYIDRAAIFRRNAQPEPAAAKE